VAAFLETKWIPLFLSKAVNNPDFRKDLDEAYLLANLRESELQITMAGKPLLDPQKSAIESSIKRMVGEERGRLGEVLLNFAEAAQTEINTMRKELLAPIDSQERMVVDEINGAWADLLAGQAAISAHLESVVEVQKSQEEALRRIGVLEEREKVLDTLMQYNDRFTDLLGGRKDIQEVIEEYKDKIKDLEKTLKELIQ
jgi:chromosome segregation ATPase